MESSAFALVMPDLKDNVAHKPLYTSDTETIKSNHVSNLSPWKIGQGLLKENEGKINFIERAKEKWRDCTN